MKRAILYFFACVALSAALVIHEREPAEASGGAGGGDSVTLATGSGGAVGASGPIALTGPVSITGALAVSGPVTVTAPGTNNNAISATAAGTGNGVVGNAASGVASSGVLGDAGGNASSYGVYAKNTNGYALVAHGDQTSPSKSPILILTQDAAPNGNTSTLGQLYMHSDGRLRAATATGNPPTFNDVAGFMQVTTGITAFATGGQASATAICTNAGNFIISTVASANDSVKFPATPVVGQECAVKNKGANTLALFPNTGDVICVAGSACGAANASTTIAANGELYCYAESTSTWNCK